MKWCWEGLDLGRAILLVGEAVERSVDACRDP